MADDSSSFISVLVTREEGATMLEYGLMLALIAIFCVGVVTLIGQATFQFFDVPGWN